MDGDALAASRCPGGYFSGSSVTTTTRLAPSAATCARDLRHGEAAVVRLAAGHRDRVVVEDLVGDVDAGRDRGADRQIAGVVVGAVAEILEHVRRAWRTAPRRSSWRPRRPSGCSRASSGPSTAPCSGSRCRHRRAMPSGTTVEELCGQPEQKYGVRTATSCVSASALLRLLQPRDAARQIARRRRISAAARRCRSRRRSDRARP